MPTTQPSLLTLARLRRVKTPDRSSPTIHEFRLPNSSHSLCKDPCRLLDHLADDFSRRSDLLHEAYTLPGEKVHGLDISAGVSGRRNPAKARERSAYSTERNLADDWLVGTLLRAALLLRQPPLNKGSTQCSMISVRPTVTEERGADRVFLTCGSDFLLVDVVSIAFRCRD